MTSVWRCEQLGSNSKLELGSELELRDMRAADVNENTEKRRGESESESRSRPESGELAAEPLQDGDEPDGMVVESRHDYGSFPSPATNVNGRQGERSRAPMDESDSYMQSRPLLQDDGWRGTENGDIQHEGQEPAGSGGFYQTAPAGGAAKTETSVRVNIGAPPPPRFPKEKLKTLLALLWMVFNFLLTLTSLAITHERVPETAPLPDVVLDNVPTGSWALKVSETVIIVMVNSAFLVVLLHKHRFIVFRRIFLVMGLLYMMRSVLYFVTALPKPDPDYQCEKKAGYLSFTLVVTRVLKLLGGFGLSINGQHVYCGDYIYSGHTVTLAMAYMVLREYTPRHWWVLHWASLLAAITGVVMVLVARGHYTVDVLLAYYVSTRVFWMYHTMANNASLKESGPNNYLSRLWWFFMFRYFEKNVSGPVPRHYEWPLPWPRCLQNKRPERTS